MKHNLDTDILPLEDLAEALGHRLETYRISRGLKQAELADMAGIGRVTLIRFESGAAGTVDTLLRILRALDLEQRILDLFPDASASPLDPASGRDRPRQRVRDRADTQKGDQPWQWGEEDGR